jgi:hypothetical protein
MAVAMGMDARREFIPLKNTPHGAGKKTEDTAIILLARLSFLTHAICRIER